MNDSIYIVRCTCECLDDLDFIYSKTDCYIYTQMGIFKRLNDEYFKISIDHKNIKNFFNNEDIKIFHEIESKQDNDVLTRIPFQHFHVETVEETFSFQDNIVVTKIT